MRRPNELFFIIQIGSFDTVDKVWVVESLAKVGRSHRGGHGKDLVVVNCSLHDDADLLIELLFSLNSYERGGRVSSKVHIDG